MRELDASCRIIDEMNPCATMKAVKNATEIENMRKAHLKDGIAVTKFMYWLKHTIGTCDMTEMTAAHKIERTASRAGQLYRAKFRNHCSLQGKCSDVPLSSKR